LISFGSRDALAGAKDGDLKLEEAQSGALGAIGIFKKFGAEPGGYFLGL